MKRIAIYLSVLISLLLFRGGQIASAQGKTELRLNLPETIVKGRTFAAEYTINADARNFKMETPKGLEVSYGPSIARSNRTMIINGQHSSEQYTSFTVTFLANEEGEVEVPAASVQVGNTTYRTKGRKLTVYAAAADDTGGDDHRGAARNNGGVTISDKDIFVRATANKTKVYEQEGFLVTFRIYSRHDFQFEDVKFPEFDGFIAQDVPMPQTLQLRQAEEGGRSYSMVEIKQTYLFAQRPGKLRVPSGSFQVLMSVPVRRQFNSMDSFFEDFFGSTQTIRKNIKSAPLDIEVMPLPTPRPEGFDNAVGQFDLHVEAPAQLTKANESITYKLVLKGKGNLKLVQVPVPQFPEGFESYDPKEDAQIEVTPQGVMGTRTVEYFAVPRFAGDYDLEPMRFVYFDPATAQYKTINVPPAKIHVDKGVVNANATSVSDFSDKQDVKYLNKDIRYIKRAAKGTTRYTLPSPTLVVWVYPVVLLLALLTFILLRRRGAERANVRGYNMKRAGKHARKWLKLAAEKQTSGDHAAYYEALLKGLSGYISHKYQIPLSAMSKENIEQVLTQRNLPTELIGNTLTALSDLELARYAPETDQTARGELYDRCARVIEGLESSKVK